MLQAGQPLPAAGKAELAFVLAAVLSAETRTSRPTSRLHRPASLILLVPAPPDGALCPGREWDGWAALYKKRGSLTRRLPHRI